MSVNTAVPVFEVHLGISDNASALLGRLDSERSQWACTEISEVVTGPKSMNTYHAHDVPGVLRWMVTKHVNDFDLAISEANRVTALYESEPDIRVEVEQVLMTDVEGLSALALPVQRTPWPEDLEAGELIEDIPPFETHFSIVSRQPRVPVQPSTRELIQLAESLGIRVEQAVRFAVTGQVILTMFFDDFEEMKVRTLELAPPYRGALAVQNLRLKVVSERIISCLKPRKYSPATQPDI